MLAPAEQASILRQRATQHGPCKADSIAGTGHVAVAYFEDAGTSSSGFEDAGRCICDVPVQFRRWLLTVLARTAPPPVGHACDILRGLRLLCLIRWCFARI